MASTINADTTNGVIVTSDTSGIIEFQSSGTTKAGVNATGLTGNGSQLTALPDPDALSTASGSAPSYSARAWVNFNGSGTVAIRASGNVSSITDNSTGNYIVNLTTAMPDVNYSALGSFSGIADAGAQPNGNRMMGVSIISTTEIQLNCRSISNVLEDYKQIFIGIIR